MELTLLLVDDDVTDRIAVKRALKRAGIKAHVVEAETAPEALETARGCGAHCVLLDYQLPGGDGLSVLRELREQHPGLPVIALTGFGDEQLVATMMKAGAADYLSKSTLTPEVLERSIRHALTMAAVERERAALLAREQRALQEARSANRAKDEFLAALSHELRTPLNAILGWARLLSRGALDAAAAERAVATIERNAVLQVKLIDDLLDVSRIVTGKLVLEKAPVDIASLVVTVVDSLRPAAEAGGIALTCSRGVDRLGVLADAARLQQVISNLVSNAIKFTPRDGTVAVTLETDDRLVRITVADTGEGIDADFLPHVFERFTQGGSPHSKTRAGLGLGLSIVKHLAELHGGSVRALSEGPGRGTTMIVELPLAIAASLPVSDAAGQELPSLENITVLLIDDDGDGRDVMAAILRERGAKVATAAAASEGLAEAMLCQPTVILTDLAMPGIDGYCFVEQLRAAGAAMPVVAVSAFAGPEDRAKSMRAGFVLHLAKPVEPNLLVSTVATLAGRMHPHHPTLPV